jgi:hypothetical protein
MSEGDSSSGEYGSSDSTEVAIQKEKINEEQRVDPEYPLYGNNKPKRDKIRVKVTHD